MQKNFSERGAKEMGSMLPVDVRNAMTARERTIFSNINLQVEDRTYHWTVRYLFTALEYGIFWCT